MKSTCVFCKIVKGDLPMHKIYENDYTLAFLDISKNVDGHTLVIPKKHYNSLLDVENYIFEQVMLTVRKVARHYVKNCGFSGINISNANCESAGQSVPQLHFHIFPRKDGDKAHFWIQNNLATKSLEEMQKLLQLTKH